MAKEEKPLEYQQRVRDTKGIAQRLDLDYLKRPRLLAVMRSRLTWGLTAAAVLGSVPLVLGVGGSRRPVANGPLSEAHALFADRCEVCHARKFQAVTDRACQKCHDGAAHPAKLVDTAKANEAIACVECHTEHKGKTALAVVESARCTQCHADLANHASGVKLKALRITGFSADTHPEFSTAGPGVTPDLRPIKLNHAAHMPSQSKEIRGMRLPMACGDCHVTDHKSATGALLPVTFEQNCKRCHARELEFDVYHVLGGSAAPAPHSKDAKAIHEFISEAYASALAANPGLARKPLGNDLTPAGNWLARVVKDSEDYLFQRKCGYCHESENDDSPQRRGDAEKTKGNENRRGPVKPVNRIAGRYVEGKAKGDPWFARGEFAHRSHRAVECESCHTGARTSRKTSDVLIPAMKSCLPCHGKSEAGLDRCSLCHQYHNRDLEKEVHRGVAESRRAKEKDYSPQRRRDAEKTKTLGILLVLRLPFSLSSLRLCVSAVQSRFFSSPRLRGSAVNPPLRGPQ